MQLLIVKNSTIYFLSSASIAWTVAEDAVLNFSVLKVRSLVSSLFKWIQRNGNKDKTRNFKLFKPLLILSIHQKYIPLQNKCPLKNTRLNSHYFISRKATVLNEWSARSRKGPLLTTLSKSRCIGKVFCVALILLGAAKISRRLSIYLDNNIIEI